ncbi:hypothetical protein AB0H73_06260 [Streptomyces olivoreticuli]
MGTCKNETPEGVCGAPVKGRPYLVILNCGAAYEKELCGPCVPRFEAQQRQLIGSARELPYTRVDKSKRYQDRVGVLATKDDIKSWLLRVLENNPSVLTQGELELLRPLASAEGGAKASPGKRGGGRLSGEYIDLWRNLRPKLEDSETDWKSNDGTPQSVDAVRALLLNELLADPDRFTDAEVKAIQDLSEGGALTRAALVAYGKVVAAQRAVRTAL